MNATSTLPPLACALALAACAPPPDAGDVLYVRPPADGEWDDPASMALVAGFGTIQDAIDAASPGDTIEIPSGTFNEMVVLTSGLTLHGAGQGQTVVVGRIRMEGGSDATISSLTVQCVSSVGIYLTAPTNVLVQDVEVTDCNAGLLLEDFPNNILLDDLYLHGNDIFGVELQGTEQVTLSNSLVISNGFGGLYSTYSYGSLIAHNTFVGNGFAASPTSNQGGIDLDEGSEDVVANNIVTGNTHGLECLACEATWSSNLIWGNNVDYAGEASAGAGDLASDPGFVDPTEGDYHLDPASPAIDSGDPALSVATDADGDARPVGAAPDRGLDEYAPSALALVLTEVMANPSDEGTGEFVEVLNAGGVAVDLAGLVLSDGDQEDALVAFDAGVTTLQPGARAVVVDSQYAGQYSIDAAVTLLTTADNTLGNGLTTSDPVLLLEADAQTTIASFSFPGDPGDGTSLELSDVDAGDVAGNWQPSVCAAGHSPGGPACFPEAGDAGALVITEVLANAVVEASGEFVELWNSGSEPINGAGLVLEDGGGHDDTLQALQGGVALIQPGEHALVVDPDWDYSAFVPAGVVLLTTGDSSLGNGLSTADEVTLLQPDGSTVIDTFTSPSDPGDGVSIERIDYATGDVPTNWQPASVACTSPASPGRLNGAAGGACGALVVNEVMSNPLSESSGEYVELFNAGLDDVDLDGLVLSDGDAPDVLVPFEAGPTVLPAGGFALVIDSGFAGDFVIPGDAIVMTSPDATIGNALSTTDEITLFEADGVTVIDAFGFPFNPGNGVSAERVEIGGAPDAAANWEGSTCGGGGSPGFANCVTTGASGNDDSDSDLLITEVMSNPLVEATGEYVELYNDGVDPVDLAGAILWDGDAADPLEGWIDPAATVLDPGGWAVILDAGYTGQYAIPAGALLLTTDDAALASGLSLSDPVTLFEPDGVTILATFSWPLDAGNGNPVERLDLAVGDLETNWAAASCGPPPGGAASPRPGGARGGGPDPGVGELPLTGSGALRGGGP